MTISVIQNLNVLESHINDKRARNISQFILIVIIFLLYNEIFYYLCFENEMYIYVNLEFMLFKMHLAQNGL